MFRCSVIFLLHPLPSANLNLDMPKNQPINVSLFVTCLVDQVQPQVCESVVRVLEREGVKVDFSADQTSVVGAHGPRGTHMVILDGE